MKQNTTKCINYSDFSKKYNINIDLLNSRNKTSPEYIIIKKILNDKLGKLILFEDYVIKRNNGQFLKDAFCIQIQSFKKLIKVGEKLSMDKNINR